MGLTTRPTISGTAKPPNRSLREPSSASRCRRNWPDGKWEASFWRLPRSGCRTRSARKEPLRLGCELDANARQYGPYWLLSAALAAVGWCLGSAMGPALRAGRPLALDPPAGLALPRLQRYQR